MKRIISLPIVQVFLLVFLLTTSNSCNTEIDPKLLPVLTTTDVIKITEASAQTGGNITSDAGSDITARGVCWGTSPNPTIEDNKTSDAAGTGVFTSKLTGLIPSTTYYVRAFATNKKGTAYGIQLSFSTKSLSLITTEVTSITINSAKSGGTIATDGDSINVSVRGICWGTQSNPTILNSKTTDGKSSGKFTSSMTDLILGTTYYVRAYVTNSGGTIYGNELIFMTQNGAMTLSTTPATFITATSVTIGGSLPSDGGSPVNERGICISKLPSPTVSNKMAIGFGTGSFTTNISGLTANTTYYVRAYATNSLNTTYGNEVSFTTLDGIVYLSTSDASSITITSATIVSTITSDGGSSIFTSGVCWNTTTNPTTANSKSIDGKGIGSFASSITGLTTNTTYYVRAYATNSFGTFYGNQISFTTPPLTATVTDIDGNIYHTITIGNQVWMVENLKTTLYNDGTPIPLETNGTSWGTLSTPAYCFYSNNSNYKNTYGVLYNWYAVNTGKLAPTGWHVPTDAEWTTLTTYLGGESIAGGKLKETGTSHWTSPNTGATNETCFYALPGGCRANNGGNYISLSNGAFWWSSSEYGTYAWSRRIWNYGTGVERVYVSVKQYGKSVRCIKD